MLGNPRSPSDEDDERRWRRALALLLISGTQFTLFGMWFDQEANKELR